jgi:hypothetical protein
MRVPRILALLSCAVALQPQLVIAQEGRGVLRGPYLGQEPPGESPRPFAPAILTAKGAIHGQIAFHPNGREIYWIFLTAASAQAPPPIHFVKEVNGGWTAPSILPFSEEHGADNISISPDGKRLYFHSRRPWPAVFGRQGATYFEAFRTWYVERVASEWGEPTPLDPRLEQTLAGVSSTLDGTLYTHGIRRARLHDGRYTEWEQLGRPLKVGRVLGGNPFISPDERYILFNGRWAGKSGYGILVSYRTRDDRWTEPVNLLERLSASRGGSQPIVTPDGSYLFYYAGGRFWWVNATIIERLRPADWR